MAAPTTGDPPFAGASPKAAPTAARRTSMRVASAGAHCSKFCVSHCMVLVSWRAGGALRATT
eukprot:9176273-Alexandrium_andersonii.AAC.1